MDQPHEVGTASTLKKKKRPASVITALIVLGFCTWPAVIVVIVAISHDVFSMLFCVQIALFAAAFLCSMFFRRAHTTFYLVNAALALLVIKGIWTAMTPHLYIPPIPEGSPFAYVSAIILSAGFAALFWRHAFGKPSREFYGFNARNSEP